MARIGEEDNFDVRLVSHFSSEKKKEYEKKIKSLPDESENAVWVDLEEENSSL